MDHPPSKRRQSTKTDVPYGAVRSDETMLDLIPTMACLSTSLLDRRGHPVPIIGMNEFKVALP